MDNPDGACATQKPKKSFFDLPPEIRFLVYKELWKPGKVEFRYRGRVRCFENINRDECSSSAITEEEKSIILKVSIIISVYNYIQEDNYIRGIKCNLNYFFANALSSEYALVCKKFLVEIKESEREYAREIKNRINECIVKSDGLVSSFNPSPSEDAASLFRESCLVFDACPADVFKSLLEVPLKVRPLIRTIHMKNRCVDDQDGSSLLNHQFGRYDRTNTLPFMDIIRHFFPNLEKLVLHAKEYIFDDNIAEPDMLLLIHHILGDIRTDAWPPCFDEIELVVKKQQLATRSIEEKLAPGTITVPMKIYIDQYIREEFVHVALEEQEKFYIYRFHRHIYMHRR